MKTQNNFQIGQVVTYKVCSSTYIGVIVKIKNNSLIVIDCASGMALWNAGHAVGDEISLNQVI